MTIDEQLLAADRAARTAALDVERSFIVQAPAGSGKTELLIQRYLGLLGTVDEPEEVIAITFTRKATAEMRLRVVEALRRAADGIIPAEPHLRITADAAARVLDRDRERGWQLVRHPRRLRIQTLDALNGSIARMQPLTAASTGAGTVLATDSEMDRLYRDAATATLDWLSVREPAGAVTKEVLLHIDNSTPTYVDYLSRMLRTRDQWLPFISSGAIDEADSVRLRARFEANLERVVGDRLATLRRQLPDDLAANLPALAGYAVANLRAEGKPDHPLCALGAEPVVPTADPADLPQWQGLAEFVLTGQGQVRKRLTKNEGFPPGDGGEKARMSELLDALREEPLFAELLHATRELPDVHYSDEQWAVLVALFRLLPVAVGELRRLCLGRGITDHVEVAINAEVALGTADEPGDVALLLDYQVRHILVDEMQDTSKAQYRLLESLTGGWVPGDGRTLFCVGDPMQSVYRFRNAEVAQFLLARDNGIGSVDLEPLVLRRNFRSGERLVEWFNGVFPGVLAAMDDPFMGAVSYSSAVAVEGLAGQGEVGIHPVFGSDTRDEAERGVEVVRELLGRSEDETIAILVRSRTQLPALLARLRQHGVTYQAVDIDRLTDLPEIIDCMALTRAAAHPGDRLAWLGLLRSPWIGLDWTDLHALVRDRAGDTIPELLHDDERLSGLSAPARAAIERALPVLDSLLRADGSSTLQQRIETAWFALGGPALLEDDDAIDNVYRFFDAVATLETGGSIADIARLVDLLDSERVSTHSAARVQVLTMHKSKGLQFDHVVLYGLGRHSAGNRQELLTWFDLPDPHGEEDKVMSPVGRRDALESDPLHRFIGRVENQKDAFEQARLLYVACTRAKRSLQLVGHVAETRSGDEMGKPNARSHLALLWAALEPAYAAAFDPDRAPASGDGETAWFRPMLRRFDAPWRLPEVTGLPSAGHGVEADGVEERIEYAWVGAEARVAGSVIHRCLDLATRGRLELDAARLAAFRPVAARWAKELGGGRRSIDAIVARVESALEALLSDERGRWVLFGPGESELPLTGIVDGRAENVIIDRVRIDEDGTHWIVDYKTSTHLGSDLDRFIAEEIRRYTPQMTRYAEVYTAYAGEPVRCALYFPLLGRFEEVPV